MSQGPRNPAEAKDAAAQSDGAAAADGAEAEGEEAEEWGDAPTMQIQAISDELPPKR